MAKEKCKALEAKLLQEGSVVVCGAGPPNGELRRANVVLARGTRCLGYGMASVVEDVVFSSGEGGGGRRTRRARAHAHAPPLPPPPPPPPPRFCSFNGLASIIMGREFTRRCYHTPAQNVKVQTAISHANTINDRDLPGLELQGAGGV
jgi:hypothetical protein